MQGVERDLTAPAMPFVRSPRRQWGVGRDLRRPLCRLRRFFS